MKAGRTDVVEISSLSRTDLMMVLCALYFLIEPGSEDPKIIAKSNGAAGENCN